MFVSCQMVLGQKIDWEKKPLEIWQVLYWRQLVNEQEVATEDLEVLEALSEHKFVAKNAPESLAMECWEVGIALRLTATPTDLATH
jgi:hypothetical protein